MQVIRGSAVHRHKKCVRFATPYMQANIHVRSPLVSDQLSRTPELP